MAKLDHERPKYNTDPKYRDESHGHKNIADEWLKLNPNTLTFEQLKAEKDCRKAKHELQSLKHKTYEGVEKDRKRLARRIARLNNIIEGSK